MAIERQHEDFWVKLRRIAPELRPRPNTGRLWQDVVCLVLVIALQVGVLPSLVGGHVALDLVTPWLAISFVRQRAPQATVLALVAGFTLETHSSLPAGLYLTSYWIMANVIIQVRPALSWRHRVPWLATFTLAEVWIIAFATFVQAFMGGMVPLDGWLWLGQAVEIVVAIFFGMRLCQPWLQFDAEEPVPQ